MHLTMLQVTWDEIWRDEIRERWKNWKPSKTDYADFFAKCKTYTGQEVISAAQRLKLQGTKKPTIEAFGQMLRELHPAEPIKPALRNFDGTKAKKQVYLKMIISGDVPAIVAKMPLFQELKSTIEERLEERISISFDGATDEQILAEYQSQGLHPAHARNKLEKAKRLLREQLLKTIENELNERKDNG